MLDSFDIIVVGAGHAGCEAAYAGGAMGCKVLLITHDMTKMAQMSCNPAMGGIAKGQIVREIDALGGMSGIVTDKSTIQFRMLNKSKGPAMWSPRAQCDRALFSLEWRKALENNKNVSFFQDDVKELLIESFIVKGVKTAIGFSFYAKTVILTNGTFLDGLIHIGKFQMAGGRIGELPSHGLSNQLAELGFQVERLKTGTPARLDGRTIDFSSLLMQDGDDNPSCFSFLGRDQALMKQRPCYITYTSEKVHDELRKGFSESPLFSGVIKGRGPRYCPSVEDKIVTFDQKEKHQLFLEPEGWETNEYYINGFSSSLPWNVQLEALRKIEGLENVKIFRPGYAIEYDYFNPLQLLHTLETKRIQNLFFAGQINGTTGYEEAAAQGLMAGINAVQKIRGNDPIVLSRDQAYIGVLIDDLVTKGIDEPYRMFTSRAEYRILLRQDNADARLTRIGFEIGLATFERKASYEERAIQQNSIVQFCKKVNIRPSEANSLKLLNGSLLKQAVKIAAFLTRPEVSIQDIVSVHLKFRDFIKELNIKNEDVLTSSEIQIKYQSYIDREQIIADKIGKLENIKLNENLDYTNFLSITTEARQKLNRIKPSTIGQASRIPGVSPSDINVLLVYLGR